MKENNFEQRFIIFSLYWVYNTTGCLHCLHCCTVHAVSISSLLF